MKIEFQGVSFGYSPERLIFENLNLQIPLRQWIAITGPCGSGKTTLAKLIAGLLKPSVGRIQLPVADDSPVPFHIGYLYQNPDDQFVHFNLERETAFNLENQSVQPTRIQTVVKETLERVRLWARRSDSPHHLAGGEKQRLALAGMLVSSPQLLILDEPTALLDVFARKELYDFSRELITQGLSIIWITQNRYEQSLADRVLNISSDRVISFSTLEVMPHAA